MGSTPDTSGHAAERGLDAKSDRNDLALLRPNLLQNLPTDGRRRTKPGEIELVGEGLHALANQNQVPIFELEATTLAG